MSRHRFYTSYTSVRSIGAGRAANLRSKVTNGSRVFAVGGDGYSPWTRRWRDLVELHVSDAGGTDTMSEAELSHCRRCASLEISLEQMEAAMSEGKEADPEIYARIASHLRRLLETPGLKRVARSREDLQNTDTELVRALTPALLTTRGPLVMISSPWCAEGEFYKACTSGWGDAGGDRSLVIHGASHELNPTLVGDEEIAASYREDPISSRSEYGAQWRDARSNFLDRAQIMELVEPINQRPAEPYNTYIAAVDMSSGLGQTPRRVPSAITTRCATKASSTASSRSGRLSTHPTPSNRLRAS